MTFPWLSQTYLVVCLRFSGLHGWLSILSEVNLLPQHELKIVDPRIKRRYIWIIFPPQTLLQMSTVWVFGSDWLLLYWICPFIYILTWVSLMNLLCRPLSLKFKVLFFADLSKTGFNSFHLVYALPMWLRSDRITLNLLKLETCFFCQK